MPVSAESTNYAGVNFDSVPQILDFQILVGCMLIVIEVRDRQHDDWSAENLLE